MSTPKSSGPLAGVRVVELAGLGPTPFTSMLLADMGAEVIRIDRVEPADFGVPADPKFQLLNRGKRSLAADLKAKDGIAIVKKLVANADVMIEGFRPGVAERLGLGPADCMAVNPRLIYARVTGWGQDGPLAQAAGHDINYIAITGALDAIGSKDGPPVPPLNLLGDFAGGSMYVAFGIACALLETRQSGVGQVIDGAIVDGTAHLMTSIFSLIARGAWVPGRSTNMVGGGRPWYGVYLTRDNEYVSFGAVEKRFYRELLERTGLEDLAALDRDDPANWDTLSERLRAVIATRTKREWTELLEGTDVCFAPVLDIDEAAQHPHMMARNVFVDAFGFRQPAPAPRFSRSEPSIRRAPPAVGQHTREILRELGFETPQIEQLFTSRVVV